MKPKILLVEDDPSVHVALAEVLRGEGYEIVSAFNAAEALLAYQGKPDIGLVLLDLNLPERSGWEIFEQVARFDPHLPIVVITARSDQQPLAESAGAVAFMEKPLNFPLLLEIIARLSAGEPAEELVHFSAGGSRGFFFDSASKTPNRGERGKA